MLKIDHIADIIAADRWSYRTSSGEAAVSRIEVGRPQRALEDPNGDWYCPVFVEGFTSRIVPAYGVGPVDALLNAMMLVKSFADQMGDFAPRAGASKHETSA